MPPPDNANTDRFRSLVQACPMGIHLYRLRPDGHLVFEGANPAAERLLGVPHDRFLGLTLEEAFPPLADTEIAAVFKRLAREGGAWETEQYHYSHDRISGAYEVHAFQTEPHHLAVLFTEVSERMAAVHRLRDQERDLNKAQQVAHFGTYSWDIDRGELVWSRELRSILGLTEGEPSYERMVSLIHPEDRPCVLEQGQRALRGEIDFTCAYRIVRPDGGVRHIFDQAEIERDNEGKPLRMFGTAHDITPLKRAEEDRRRLERQMQQAQKLESLGVLAGGVAHDFSNLLTGILGHADMARQDLPASHSAVEHLEKILAAGRRAADLCSQMLAYSGMGRGAVEPLDLSDTVRGISTLLAASVTHQVPMAYQLAQGLPATEADASQVRQVVLNLVLNAAEAMEGRAGVVRVETGLCQCDAAMLAGTYLPGDCVPGPYVFVRVSDEGCGMDAATIARLFDPFFTTKFTGRGLGLSAVLGIARGHRGAIQVESAPGRGSTFTVYFPVSALPVHPVSMEARPLAGSGHGRVLFIDDDPTVLDVVSHMLRYLGFEVLAAQGGRRGRELLDEHGGSLAFVLLDLTMPELGGEAVLRHLRGRYPALPVILASGYDEAPQSPALKEIGFSAFLHKPFDTVRLSRALLALGLLRRDE